MAKIKEAENLKSSSSKVWNSNYGTYLSGQAAIDGADYAAIAAEARWGAGRLRLLVDDKLREKFDRQRFLFNAAIWHGDLQEVQEQARRMVKAWIALEAAALGSGAKELAVTIWETALPDGTVVAIVRSDAEARAVVKGENPQRQMVVYTLEEIGRMLANYREVTEAKITFPGAKVEAIRRQSISDPLDAIRDGVTLEDTLDDPIPYDL